MHGFGDLNLKLVRAFLATEQTGSFAQAAGQLHVSQSVLSRSIAELETRVGAALFLRSRNRLTLSVAGHVFLPYARKLESAHADLATGIAAWRAKSSGQLRFICSDAILPALLPRLLETMGVALADKTLEFTDASSSEVVAAVANREYDLGICLHLEDLPTTVVQVPIAQAPIGVLSTPDFPLPAVVESYEDIAGLPMVFHNEESIIQRALLQNLPEPHTLKPPTLVSMNLAAMYAMVTSGRVAALTLATCTCHPIAKDLIFTPVGSFNKPMRISAVYPASPAAAPPEILCVVASALLQLPWHHSVHLIQ